MTKAAEVAMAPIAKAFPTFSGALIVADALGNFGEFSVLIYFFHLGIMKNDKWISFPSHFIVIFHHLIVVQASFCSWIKGITLKICMLCFVLINSIILNLLCVWIFHFGISQSFDGRPWAGRFSFNQVGGGGGSIQLNNLESINIVLMFTSLQKMNDSVVQLKVQ